MRALQVEAGASVTLSLLAAHGQGPQSIPVGNPLGQRTAGGQELLAYVSKRAGEVLRHPAIVLSQIAEYRAGRPGEGVKGPTVRCSYHVTGEGKETRDFHSSRPWPHATRSILRCDCTISNCKKSIACCKKTEHR
jgi:hypothetical protein